MSRSSNAGVLGQNRPGMVDILFTVSQPPLQSEEIRLQMSLGSVVEKGAGMAPLLIPVESYTALEHLVQTLQVQILLTAADGSGPITVDSIRRAIHQVIDAPADLPESGSEHDRRIRPPEPQAYLWLERRLDHLRGFVFRLAENVSRDANLPVVSEAAIRACWESFLSNPSLVKSVLDPDRSVVEATAAQSY